MQVFIAFIAGTCIGALIGACSAVLGKIAKEEDEQLEREKEKKGQK